MDPNSLATSTTIPRKVKFKPRAPPARSEQKLVVAKVEKVEQDADAANKELLLSLYDNPSLNVRPKREKIVEPKKNAFHRDSSVRKPYDPRDVKPHPGAAGKEYKEPWHYYSYYPVTLPLRRPYSGDPELLDEVEFGNGSESQKYDEDSINAADQLKLIEKEDDTDPRFLFLQLPSKLPVAKEHPGNDTDVNGAASNKSSSSKNRGAYDELPSGLMGKLVVYKSGVLKLKLGDNLYDVGSGVDSTFAQDVISINTKNKRCIAVEELRKRAIITPDFDSMFDNKLDL